MTKEELEKLEETIALSFIRSNVLSVDEAKAHAGLAVDHVKRALRLAGAGTLSTASSVAER